MNHRSTDRKRLKLGKGWSEAPFRARAVKRWGAVGGSGASLPPTYKKCHPDPANRPLRARHRGIYASLALPLVMIDQAPTW